MSSLHDTYCVNNPVMYSDISGQSWESFWDDVEEWFNQTFGFTLYTESSTTVWYGVYEIRTGGGYGKPCNKPFEFYASISNEWWKLDQYSIGVKFTDSQGNGFKVFWGTNSGFGWYNKDHGTTVSLSNLYRIGIRESTNIGNGYYKFDQVNINMPKIIGIILGLRWLYNNIEVPSNNPVKPLQPGFI